ncbi:MAG: chemotaxis protein CheB [Heteroscytonema crispum UTEX LB 1556]
MQMAENANNYPPRFANAAFDVVAMAASAGGLRALTNVLSAIPAEFPAAIVIVQHLDPRHRSLMADILNRHTTLKVKQAQEGDYQNIVGA